MNEVQPISMTDPNARLKLPVEVHLKIVECLDSESVCHYFAANENSMFIAPIFSLLNPGLFHPVKTNTSLQSLIRVVSARFSKQEFISLDERRRVVKKITALTKNLVSIRIDLPIKEYLTLGCHRKTIKLKGLQAITTYARYLQGKYYVCGIRFCFVTEVVLIGEETRNCHRNDLNKTLHGIGFVVDAFGIRSIRFASSWFPETPMQLKCWEGFFAVQESFNLQIATDVRINCADIFFGILTVHEKGLKVRNICIISTKVASSFSETMIIRPQRPYVMNCMKKNCYVSQNFEEELRIIKQFDCFTVELAQISTFLTKIVFYCSESGLILGVGIGSSSEYQYIGQRYDLIEHEFDVQVPNEVVEEIIVESAKNGGDLIATVRIILLNDFEDLDFDIA